MDSEIVRLYKQHENVFLNAFAICVFFLFLPLIFIG